MLSKRPALSGKCTVAGICSCAPHPTIVVHLGTDRTAVLHDAREWGSATHLILDIDVEPELLISSLEGIYKPAHHGFDAQLTIVLHPPAVFLLSV